MPKCARNNAQLVPRSTLHSAQMIFREKEGLCPSFQEGNAFGHYEGFIWALLRASFAHYRALGQAEAWVALSARPRLGRPYSSIMHEWEWEPAVADAKACREELGDCLQQEALRNDLRGRVEGRMPKGGLGRDLHGSARQDLCEDLQANA